MNWNMILTPNGNGIAASSIASTNTIHSPAAFILITGLAPGSIFNGNLNKQIKYETHTHHSRFSQCALQEAPPKAEPKLKEYPLKICLVSDNKLGSMGKPYKFTHEDQRVELCCKPCLKKFTKEPVKYLKKLEPKKK